MTQDMSGQRRPEQSRSEPIKETAAQFTASVQEQAGAVAAQAQDQVKSRIATQKDSAAESLSGVAHALRQTGQQLRDQNQSGPVGLLDEAATQMERLSTYLQGNDLNRLVGDVESFARRQPALFLGGAFLVGLVGARFLKSTRPAQYNVGYPDPAMGYARKPLPREYDSPVGGYGSSLGREFGTTTATRQGGTAPGVYQAPEWSTGGQTRAADEPRARTNGERLEE